MKVLGSSDERFGYVKEKHDNDMYKVEFPDNITTMTRADLQLAAAEDKIRPGVMVKFKAALAEPGARPTHGWGDNVTASSVGKVVEVGDCVVIDFCGYRGFKAKLKDVELYEAKKGRCPANHALSSSHGVRPSSSSPSSPIPIGTRVELHGLKMKKLNRQRGVVAGFDADSGRCVVKLEDGREFKSKVENLKRIATTTSNSKKKKKGGGK